MHNNKSLKYLDCSSNLIKELDLSNNLNLETLKINGNRLFNLNLSNNKSLKYLGCSKNLIEEMDLSNNFLIKILNVMGNNLTNLQLNESPGKCIGGLKSYEKIFIRDNLLMDLDLSCLDSACYIDGLSKNLFGFTNNGK